MKRIALVLPIAAAVLLSRAALFSEAVCGAPPPAGSALPPPESEEEVLTFKALRHSTRDGIPPNKASVPAEVRRLAGKRVRISGYIHPGYIVKGRFGFCANRTIDPSMPKKADESVVVSLIEIGERNAVSREITVSGVFRIEEILKKKDGQVGLLYHLDQATIVDEGSADEGK
jgi:hypothetical protein